MNEIHKNKLTHGSLFSGIGGFELGAQWAGIETIWNCEINQFNKKLLAKRFPQTKQYDDIRELQYPEKVDIISGGFPCQDISNLNTKAIGINGKRSGLWSEMFRILREVRPKYVIIENSPMLTVRGFEQVLCNLSQIGYDAEWQCLSASNFGFKHIRERVYVIAYPDTFNKFSNGMGNAFKTLQWFKKSEKWGENRFNFNLDLEKMVFETYERGGIGQHTTTQPLLCGTSYGIPDQLDRLAGLGNAIVPFIGYYLFECIKLHYNTTSND